MYDAIWKTADELAWQSDERTIIVITDAEAHDKKTNHSESDVRGMLKEEGIVLDTILVGIGF
jgi:formylmethanofuran dehydrogenase subunit E-like metal-binding protein